MRMPWLVVLALCFAAGLDVQATPLFSRTFGTKGEDALGAILPVAGGGWVIAGELDVREASRDLFVAGLDPDGRVVWKQRWAEVDGHGRPRLAQAADGGWLLAVSATVGHAHTAWVVRLDALGAITWQRRFYGRADAWPHAVAAIGDGGFVIAGRTGRAEGATEGWVLVLDRLGDVVGERVLRGRSEAELTAAASSPEGAIAVAGAVDGTGWILELSDRGKLLRGFELAGRGSVRITTIDRGLAGSFVAGGTIDGARPEGFVVWVAQDGSLLRQMSPDSIADSAVEAIEVAPDGAVLVAGAAGVTLLSPSGSPVWTRGGLASIAATAAARAADGTIAVAGSTAEPGTAKEGGVFVLDPDGVSNRSCGDAQAELTRNHFSWRSDTVSLSATESAPPRLASITGRSVAVWVAPTPGPLLVSGPCAGFGGGGGCSIPAAASIDYIENACLGTEQTFYGSGQGDPPLTFGWDFEGDGTVDAFGETVTHTYAKPGPQAVVLYVTDTCASGDPETVADQSFTFIETNPTPVITESCAGHDIILDAGPDWYSQVWSPGGATSRTINIGQDTTTTWSVTVTAYNECTGSDSHKATTGLCPDRFEPDDACATTRESLAPGVTRHHNFYDDASDWTRVHACEGRTLVIETLALGAQTDTVLELYDEDCTTLLKTNDNGGGGLASRIRYTTSDDRVYAVRVRQANGTSGPGRAYDLRLTGDTAPCASFVKAIGTAGVQTSFADVRAMPDGGLAAVGTTYYVTDDLPHYRFWVVRLDDRGNVLWQKVFPGGANEFRPGISLEPTAAGGVVVTGEYNGPFAQGPAIWVLSLSPSGSVEWQQEYDQVYDQNSQRIRRTADGNLVVAGFQPGQTTQDVFALKINPAGTRLWAQQCAGTGTSDERLADLLATADGGSVVAAFRDSDVWLFKLNAAGDFVWQASFGGAGDDRLAGIDETRDGGFVFAASSTSVGAGGYDVWVVKIDAAGSIVWQRSIGTAGDERAVAVRELPDRRIVVAARESFAGAGGEDLWLLTFAADGSLIDQRTWGGGGDDVPTSLIATPDNALVIAGMTTSFGPGLPLPSAWVLKLQPDGSFPGGCSVAGTSSLAPATPTLAPLALSGGACGTPYYFPHVTDSTPVDTAASVTISCDIRLPYEVSAPEDAAPLQFTSHSAFSWEGAAGSGAAGFSVYRGVVSGLASGDYGSCYASGLGSSSTTDGGAPPAGTVWTYVVTGQNPRGESSFGNAAGEGRANLNPCP